jgi:cholesterol transport system auxiliary component
VKRRLFLTQALALGLSGCAVGRGSAPEYAHFDLGHEAPPRVDRRLSASLALDEISASGWLQSPAILYRLTYQEPAQLQAYSLSRWVASPAVLITQRLRLALTAPAARGLTMLADGVPSELVLKIDLSAFEQQVRSPTQSHVVVGMHASLVDAAPRVLRAQQHFGVEQACASVDAQGAVGALRLATDRAIVMIVEWLATASRGKA